MRVLELRHAANIGDFLFYDFSAETAGQLADDFVFPATHPVKIDLRLFEGDAYFCSFFRFGNQLGDVEQSLRRNAATMQADASRVRLRVNQGNIQAKFNSLEGRCISSRACSYDNQLRTGGDLFCVTHIIILS